MQKIKSLFIICSILCVGVTAYSQSTTTSPYSKYGVGILRSESFTQNFAMGGIGIGLRSNRNINISNPASYSALHATSFEIGFTQTSLWLSDDTQSQYANDPYIDHISFGVPVMKNKWGLSFGLLPFSSVGYNYNSVINDPIAGDVSYYFTGNGGLSKAYLGNAFSVNIDTTSSISIGANVSYIFGDFEHDEKVIYGDLTNSFNTWTYQNISVGDLGFDFGLQYQKGFTNAANEKYKLTIGATYGLATELAAKNTEIVRSFTGSIDFGAVKDTIVLKEKIADVINLPTEFGAGISFAKDRVWVLGVDFKSSDWSNVESNSVLFKYNSNYSVAAGFEIIPQYNAYTNYFKRVSYRFGARYNTSNLLINNEQLDEYGIAFGMSLPIRRAETAVPRLSLGIEYGNRGKTGNGFIKEQFININIGLSISDKWFIKRKYD